MKTRYYVVVLVILLAAVGGYFWYQKNQSSEHIPVLVPTPNQTPTVTPTPPYNQSAQTFDGRLEECCFKGWAYDNNQPVTIKIVLKNLDYENLTYTLERRSDQPQNYFLFQERQDVLSLLGDRGITGVTQKTGFSINTAELFYPGRYNLVSATFNGHPFDTSSFHNPIINFKWEGEYQKHYAPNLKYYMLHGAEDINYDYLINEDTQKAYILKPVANITGTFNSWWSPDGKYIAYASANTDRSYAGALILNVTTPEEIIAQKYKNPSRVLIASNNLYYEWLDNTRLLVAQQNTKDTDADGKVYYHDTIFTIYNAATGAFEQPMRDYIKNVYALHFSPERTKFLFEEGDPGTPGAAHRYVVTDITGKQIKVLAGFTENWY